MNFTMKLAEKYWALNVTSPARLLLTTHYKRYEEGRQGGKVESEKKNIRSLNGKYNEMDSSISCDQ